MFEFSAHAMYLPDLVMQMNDKWNDALVRLRLMGFDAVAAGLVRPNSTKLALSQKRPAFRCAFARCCRQYF